MRKGRLVNLSRCREQIVAIRAILRGEQPGAGQHAFEAVASRPHGHVQAVRCAMQQLGFAQLIGSACRLNAMIGCVRWWPHAYGSANASSLSVLVAHHDSGTGVWCRARNEHDLCGDDCRSSAKAMDWLLERQGTIEQKLAKRHLEAGGWCLRSVLELLRRQLLPAGEAGPQSRTARRASFRLNYGLVTDRRGCPVAVWVFGGATADCTTVLPQVTCLQAELGIEQMVPGR